MEFWWRRRFLSVQFHLNTRRTQTGWSHSLSQSGLLLRFVFITSARRWGFAVELEPSSLALPDFTVAASSPPDTSPCLPLLSTMPSFVKLSSLTFHIPRLALCSLFSAPPPLPCSHSSLVGLGALGDGLWGLAIQNANQALGGTSHDFPPRHGLLFCYWFHRNQTVPVTFLLSGGRAAALTAAEGLPVIWHIHSGFIFFFKVSVRTINSHVYHSNCGAYAYSSGGMFKYI